MGVSHELAPMAAANWLPYVTAGPAALTTLGAAATCLRVVPRSEKALVIRSGQPLLKPNVLNLILNQISQDVPDMRVSELLSTESLIQGPEHWIMPDMGVSEVLEGTQYHGLGRNDFNKLRRMRDEGLTKRDVKKNEELKQRIEEKLEELPPHIREKGIYKIVTGRVWLRPFIDHVEKISVTHQTTPLPLSSIESVEGQYVVRAAATWNVRPDGDNPYRALFLVNNEKNEKDGKTKSKTQELEQTVSWIINSELSHALNGMKTEHLLNVNSEVATEITQKRCEEALLKFGVRLTSIWSMAGVRVPDQILADAINGGPDPKMKELLAIAAKTAAAKRDPIVSIVRNQEYGHDPDSAA